MTGVAEARDRQRVFRVPVLPLLVVAYAGMAALLRPDIYWRMAFSYTAQAMQLAPALLILGIGVAGAIGGRRAPLRYIATLVTERAPRLLVVICLAVIGIAAFTTLKLSITQFVPFWADPPLKTLDTALHFGDPGLALHAVLPSWFGGVLGVVYGPVWFTCWFGFIGAMAMHPDAALRQRYFLTMALVFALLGSLAATLFASVGPLFYEHFYGATAYSTLVAHIASTPVGNYMEQARDLLIANYDVDRPAMGTGISAMPSMHLAVTTLNVLLLFRLNRIAGYVGCVFLLLIQIGSVYLGWHYAVDGYASILVVAGIWWLVGRLVTMRAGPGLRGGAGTA
ncbi:phosphatase PAP2 family protein [Devosia sp.]|uniref:phosphatase PAP2 family protein n=1 Tax=Devosia sp. TaxID=1871048 RepID=UPI003A8F68FE